MAPHRHAIVRGKYSAFAIDQIKLSRAMGLEGEGEGGKGREE